MLEHIHSCPLCDNTQFVDYLTCKDFTVSQEEFSIVTCATCNFIFTNPRPSATSLSKYYQSENYISHSDKASNPINILYKIARGFTLKRKVSLLNKYSTNKGKLLDIGCGTGYFLKASKNNGWDTVGVEPDEAARALATTKTGSFIAENIDEINTEDFNVITLWHVLEHIPDINPFLGKLHDLLNENGTLIAAVPNYRSFDAQSYKQYWAAYDVPRHLYHFDQATLTAIMAKHSLKVNTIIPMPLDAYYVSMLSEGYKGNGSRKYINSVIKGWKSNRCGKKTNNFSSLIYIITKK